jgi:hypothetical protein
MFVHTREGGDATSVECLFSKKGPSHNKRGRVWEWTNQMNGHGFVNAPPATGLAAAPVPPIPAPPTVHPPLPPLRDLHLSTFRLDVSTSCGICWVVRRRVSVPKTAQAEKWTSGSPCRRRLTPRPQPRRLHLGQRSGGAGGGRHHAPQRRRRRVPGSYTGYSFTLN